jgi:hypothetical protein
MTVTVTARSAVMGRRTCAVLAATSAVLHGFMATDASGPAVATLMIGMAAACLYCARELWMCSSLRAWCVVALMNVAMVAAHWSMPAHHHGSVAGQSVTGVAAQSPSILMTVATTIAMSEVALAVAVLWYRSRDNVDRLALGRGELV